MGSKQQSKSSKESKKAAGKNIRISEQGWNKIRSYCIKNGILMGAFVEKAAIDKLSNAK